jgi:hypothetical protein
VESRRIGFTDPTIVTDTKAVTSENVSSSFSPGLGLLQYHSKFLLGQGFNVSHREVVDQSDVDEWPH